MEIEEKKYSVFQNIIYLIKESLKYDRRILIYSIIAIITGVVIPVFGIYLPKAAVDLLTEHADIWRNCYVRSRQRLLQHSWCWRERSSSGLRFEERGPGARYLHSGRGTEGLSRQKINNRIINKWF